MINDKVPVDDDITEDQWEGSTCAECGGNLVEGGKFVTDHKRECPEYKYPEWFDTASYYELEKPD